MISPQAHRWMFIWLSLAMFGAISTKGQTVFLNFNTVGQYTNNFAPWNDTGGANGGNYDFAENTNDGVQGSGGVSVFQSTDTTATFKTVGWNLATNGANMTVSILVYADGANSGDKTQLGVINSFTNGLNANAGVSFESFRFIPASATTWNCYEQYCAAGGTTTSGSLGTVSITQGHWYKFVLGLTNTSGASGNLSAGCALFDYGASGTAPGANVVTFSTAESHTGLAIATNTVVFPAVRCFEDAGVSAWDNFLVFTANSAPTFTLGLTNLTVLVNTVTTFSLLADGPGPVFYTWYTNGVAVAGATGTTYTTPPMPASLTNIYVIAANSKGAVTSQAAVTVINPMTPIPLTGFNRDLVIESNAIGPSYANYGQEYNPGEGTCFYQRGLPGTTYGLPASGVFNSVLDLTQFEFQPYTANNALVMSSDTGVTSGTLSLINPAIYSSVSILANSTGGTSNNTGTVSFRFADNSTFVTNYFAQDWFFNSGFALQGTDRINIATGATSGGPTDPRFYQTTINLAAAGLTNKPLVSLTFTEANNVKATAIFAVSGLLSGSNSFTTATLSNTPASSIQFTTATLNGQILATGGYAPTVTLYYGRTDGGTNAGLWTSNISLGYELGAFSAALTNLSPGTTYYSTAAAQNVAGVSWGAPSQIFTTLAAAAPQVANLPASSIGATLATLNGQVTSTGGAPTSVSLYYGPADGGTNASGWSNSISIGQQGGAFAQVIGSLSSNTTYYFTAMATNLAGTAWAKPSLHFTTGATNLVSALAAVLTYHNDNTRLGVNSNETQLTLANVNTNTFGKLFSCTLDGFVYAQPLIMTNVNIPGKGTHNVVYVATEHNSVYAFDADNNSGNNASPLWQTSFLGPGVTTVPNSAVGSSDITPEIGITSTPVIDPTTGTIYLEVKTLEGGSTYVHRLHALDITTGLEKTNFNSPVVIACTNYLGKGSGDNDGQTPPHVLWNPLRTHSRPALTLLNGVVYMSFASHGDTQPYHGWFFGYKATNLAQAPAVYNATPNGAEGGFWDGGGGPSVDAQGNMYFQTGNGTFDGTATITTTNDYAMGLLKLSGSNGITLVDYFAPSNAVALSGSDQDLGASAPIILPDSAGSVAHPHLVVGGGKTAPIYVVDRDNMGRFNGTTGSNKIVQQFNGGPSGDRDVTPAFFNNTLYIIDPNAKVGAYTVTNALFNTTPIETPDIYNNKGGVTPSISAHGSSNAILWAIYNAGGETPTTACILRAYNATNLTQELYSSDQNTSRDMAGDAVKFTTPAIANGKVYVGAQYSLTVYGLAATFVNTPVIVPNGGIFTNSVTVSLGDTTVGASIYYTLDGTTPATNSSLYTQPFILTNSGTVTAEAFAPGAVSSSLASATFLDNSAVGGGTGLLGAYYSQQLASFNGSPTLVRTDAVINFNWQSAPPDPSISPTNFSVRWTGCLQPQYTETYTLNTWNDAGVRLWINGQLIIDHWSNQPPTQWSANIPLVAQQLYNIEMDYYYQNQGTPVAQLSWSSPSTPNEIIPQSQLYPATNPPPGVVLASPTNGAVFTAPASLTVAANAAAQSNAIAQVAFFINGQPLGAVADLPYALTTTGLAAGSYTLIAVATDTSGLNATSAPVNITVGPGSGLPLGMSNYPAAPAFYNMPPVFAGSLPALLSQTGVFTNTPAMSPVASLIPYSPNVPLWSDNALKVRYVSIPNSGPPYLSSDQIAYAPTGVWSFPSGTVFVKTFELLTNQSDPNSIHRLETRLLVRDTNGAVYGVTYKWRPDNSDADLLSGSLSESIPITTTNGTITQTWYYPSPSDCLQCHTPIANYVLGVNARQLNGNFTYPGGVTDNQLRTLNGLGLLYPAIDASSISNIEQLSAVTNTTASFEQRARSYLDANCAQCHQPNGPGPTFDARYDTPLASQNIINTPAVKGNLGYDNVDIVTPGDLWRSSLYDRMDIVGPAEQMPPLARNLIDTNAVQLMAAWINSLPGTPALPPPLLAPAGGTFMGYASVTVTSPTNGVALYYTADGSLPTTNSALYSGPLLITNSLTLSVNAWKAGYINSVISSAQFTILPGIFFNPGGQLTNGSFQMTFSGPPGSNYVLQFSTNLLQWIPLSTNTPLNSSFPLFDPNTSNDPARFYRVVQKP